MSTVSNRASKKRPAPPSTAPRPAEAPSEKLFTLLDKFLSQHPDCEEGVAAAGGGSRELRRREVFRRGTKPKGEGAMSVTEKFLVHLASALYAYGTPSHALYYHMQQVAKGLGHQADFSCFPTFMLVAFRHRDEPAAHPLYFSANAGQDLFKLQLVDELARRVASYGSPSTMNGGFAHHAALSASDLEAGHGPVLRRRPGVLRAATMGSVSSFTDVGVRPSKRNSLQSEPERVRFDDVARKGSILVKAVNAFKRKGNTVPPADVRDVVESPVESKAESDSDSDDEESDLKQWILDLASFGHGFFQGMTGSKHDKKDGHDSDHDSDSDEESSSSRPLLKKKRSKQKELTINAKEAHAVNVSTEQQTDTPVEEKPQAPSPADMADAFELIAVEDATRRLKQIVSLPDFYPEWAQYLLTGIACGGGAGLFFGGGWWDVLVSTILGCFVGFMGGIFEGQRTLDKIYEFAGAVIVSFIVRTLVHFGLPLCYSASVLSSCMFLLQGVTITLALVELGTRHMISGTARLAYGVTMTGLIGYGLDLGATFSSKIFDISKVPNDASDVCPGELDAFVKIALFLPTSLALSMSSLAHPLQLPGMTVVSAVGFSVYTLASGKLSENLSSAVGAFAVGVTSNIHARWANTPAIVNDLGGLSMLFPGGLAVKGIMKVIEGSDIVDGLGLSLGVLAVGLSLGVGLFLANVVAPLPFSRIGGLGRRRGRAGPLVENLHF
ncbi:hypothetical protein HDU87_002617 [Geranomyces variabilis]|uniref:Threonine/serine exporter-like N-terminal domain-containing protein n=1 Tax=Geranomyces variabilis TaxID=109894 RepID=A0AAD5TRH0_9FUNG|nr:hypothetical protein HDU87_002617 [Geranomyces variabilis]